MRDEQMQTTGARSLSWPSWLQKPSQWRWPSSKRLLILVAVMLTMVLVFEAAFLTSETKPFLMRSAMKLRAVADPDYARRNDAYVHPSDGSIDPSATSGSTTNASSIVNTTAEQDPGANIQATNSTAMTKDQHVNAETTIVTVSSVNNSGTNASSKGTGINSADTKSLGDKNVPKTEASSSNLANASKTCSPQTIDPDSIAFSSDQELYSLLQMGLKYPPPVFEGDATALCDAGEDRLWEYCLPISGDKDETKCHGKDQFDLMRPHTPSSLCFNSALHMMLVDVYEDMKHTDLHPAILYGTLLGAVRDGLTISFTEDADIGYNTFGKLNRMRKLKRKLSKKGYHMFYHKIWRVCIASTHPLASNLYNPDMELLRGAWDAPYVDLYAMKLQNATTYNVEEAKPNPMISRNKIEPFSQVMLHGRMYDTVADPVYLLTREYGANYMTPKSRKQRAPRTRKPIAQRNATTLS